MAQARNCWHFSAESLLLQYCPASGGRSFSQMFESPFHNFDFFEFILENYPIHIYIYCICASCVTLPGWDPVLVDFFFISVTRF